MNFFHDDVEVVQSFMKFATDVVYLATQSFDALGSSQDLLVKSEVHQPYFPMHTHSQISVEELRRRAGSIGQTVEAAPPITR